MVGRPTDFTPELAARICEQLAQGQSLRQIARMDGMPDRSTILRWVDKSQDFRDQYARAREAGLDAMADEIVEIADDGTGDEWTDDNGVEHVNSDVINRSRLRVDTRKWIMSKLAPKKYGDRVDHAVTGDLNINIVRFADDKPAK